MTRLHLRSLGLARYHRQCAFPFFFHTSTHADAAAAAASPKSKPEQPKSGGEAAAGAAADSKPADVAARPPPSAKVVKLAKELSDLSVMEFADLTDLLKKKLGLDNANITVPMMMPAGMMMPGMVAGGGAAAPAAAAPVAEEKPVEKQVFDVKLEKYETADKIKVIKEVRAFTELGLKEAKDLVEKLPALVKKSVTKDEGAKILEKLKAVGGTAVLE